MSESAHAVAPSHRPPGDPGQEPEVDARDREEEEDEGAEQEPAIDPFDKEPGERD